MSRFLGPIHLWLHNKITSQERLELAVIDHIAKAGYAVDAALESDQLYGSPTPDEVLEVVIDPNNIHGWLQQRITQAETRFAHKITQLKAHHGDVISQLAETVYALEGTSYAEMLKADNHWDGTLQAAQKLLHNYILEGMPCDQAGAITLNEEKQLQWQSNRCLHSQYWHAVSGDAQHHHVFRDAFSAAYFKALGDIQYSHEAVENQHHYNIQL